MATFRLYTKRNPNPNKDIFSRVFWMGMRNRVHNIVMPIFWKVRELAMTAFVTVFPKNEPLGTVDDLKAWYDGLEIVTETHGEGEYAYTTTSRADGKFGVSEPGGTDFNREINHPGKNPNFIRGVVAIRFDDDFWVCATMPYRFRELTGEQIINVIYPDCKDYEIRPDSKSPEQDAYYAKVEQDHVEWLETYELWRKESGKEPDE